MNSNILKIQYLGCSAFVFQYSNREIIGIDFWTKNAFAYAEDMPNNIGIDDGGILTKLLVSHDHKDHCFIPNNSSVLYGVEDGKVKDTLNLLQLSNMFISKYSSEHFNPLWAVGSKSNAVFVLNYNDIKICHLADSFGTILDDSLLNDLKMRIGNINILLLPIDNPNLEKINSDRLLKIIDTFCPNIVIPMHYFSLSHKIEFLNDASKNGYEILNIERNFVEMSLDDKLLAKRKEILNIKAGKFVSIKTIE